MVSIKDSIKIQEITFPNRLVMAPLVTWYADKKAEVTPAHLKHYENSIGPGLIIVEATTVSPEGRLADTQLGIFEDRHVEGLKKLAEIIRKSGGVPGIQIHHAGRSTNIRKTYGEIPVCPSILPEDLEAEREIREMDKDDIVRVQECFKQAALRAEAAGFVYIELHAAHGFLISQFLSPLTNRRQDAYGGSLKNRQRFLIETFKKVKAVLKPETILSTRLGAVDEEHNGLSLEEGIKTAVLLEQEGAPLLNISFGIGVREFEDKTFSNIMNIAAAVRKHVNVPIIGVGEIILAEQAQKAIDEGMCDMVAAGRAMLADPGWARKSLAGEPVSRCFRCTSCLHLPNEERGNCPARKANLV